MGGFVNKQEVIFIFRDCFFEFAGRYSGDYNLIMSYVDSPPTDFDSGGKFELKTDTLPTIAESVLYSVEYSEQPMEFSIEITNIDEAIPFGQLIEIKEWLFANSGWKKLKLESSDYRGYYIMCFLVPEEDIADGYGYRGIRCTVKSISGFWYRDEETAIFTQSDMEGHIGSNGNFSIPINVKTDPSLPIYPIIECKLASSDTTTPVPFWVKNQTNGTVLSMLLSDSSITTVYNQNVMIDSQYPFFYKNDKTNFAMSYAPTVGDIKYGLLRLDNGTNNIQVACHAYSSNSNYRYYDYFQIHYTSKIRIGGF